MITIPETPISIPSASASATRARSAAASPASSCSWGSISAAHRVDAPLALLRGDPRRGSTRVGRRERDDRLRPVLHVRPPVPVELARPGPWIETQQQAGLGRQLLLRLAPRLEEARIAGDHVAPRARLEVEDELLDPDAGNDGLLGGLLGVRRVAGRSEGIHDEHELDDEEADEDASGDQDPCCQAEAHHQILSGTWLS